MTVRSFKAHILNAIGISHFAPMKDCESFPIVGMDFTTCNNCPMLERIFSPSEQG